MIAAQPHDSKMGLLSISFYLIFYLIFLIVTCVIIPLILYFKRKRQIGKRWTYPLSAKVSIDQIPLICKHCQCNLFHKREALIATTWINWFFKLYWNQSGAAYECKKCGFLHWFSRPKETEVIFQTDKEEV